MHPFSECSEKRKNYLSKQQINKHVFIEQKFSQKERKEKTEKKSERKEEMMKEKEEREKKHQKKRSKKERVFKQLSNPLVKKKSSVIFFHNIFCT